MTCRKVKDYIPRKRRSHICMFLKIILSIYVFFAVLYGHIAVRAFLSLGRPGATLVAVCGSLIVVVSLVAEHGL